MQNGNWEKIEEIFNRAVLKAIDEREAFVNEACRGDENLRREVCSLLAAEPESDEIFSESVFPLVAQFLSDDDVISLSRISQLGSYQLKKLLGRGGMGTVFLAEDTRLERPVALKVLPSALAQSTESLMRFQQEAKAASSVFHHNVAHIYEFDSQNGYHFLVMEHIDGKTLRDLIREEQIDVTEAVKIARQIADALAAAHKAGITHRDIKPENIMMSANEKVVKVLDFGLAKLRDKKQNGSMFKTLPGLIIGTTAYMSPEQIRLGKVDERTDLWSLGVVLYEMLEGKRPFSGETVSDVQAAVLLAECSPLSLAEEIPELERIVRKALSKDISQRYRTAKEFAADLKQVQRQVYDFVNLPELPAEDKPKRFKFPSSSKYFIGAILLFCIFVAGYAYFSQTEQLSVQKSLRIGSSGRAVRAALSPNGEFMAMAIEEAEKHSLILRPNELRTSTKYIKTLIPPDLKRITNLSFSPNNKFVYFGAKNPDETVSNLYRISVDGGSPQEIIKNIESPVSFSPDGKQFVFLRLSDDESSESLIIADAEGTNERVFYTRRMPEYIPHLAQPSWSPDGKTITCAAGKYAEDEKTQQVVPVAIRAASGVAEPIFKEPWAEIWHTAWLGDGSGFIMSARADSSYDNKQLWFVAYPGGKVTRLTDDFNDYYGVSVARKASVEEYQVATIILERAAQLWTADLSDANNTAKQISEGSDEGFGVSWAKNGEIVFGSMIEGNSEILKMKPDSSEKKQLTDDVYANKYPIVTTNGKYVLFISERSGVKSLWRMDANGKNPVLLIRGVSSQPFSVSPDGRYVYYHSYFDGAGALWRASIENGKAEKLAAGSLEFPAVSPDGKYIATVYAENGDNKKMLAIKSAEEPEQIIYKLKPAEGINISAAVPTPIRWTRNGKAVAYVVSSKGADNIWTQNIEDGSSEQLTDFINNRIYSFDLSPDGKKIVYSRGEQSRFATLLKIK